MRSHASFYLFLFFFFSFAAAAETKKHSVVYGDTMYNIALENKVGLETLLAHNRQYKRWIDKKTGFLMVLIKPGDVVDIPERNAAPVSSARSIKNAREKLRVGTASLLVAPTNQTPQRGGGRMIILSPRKEEAALEINSHSPRVQRYEGLGHFLLHPPDKLLAQIIAAFIFYLITIVGASYYTLVYLPRKEANRVPLGYIGTFILRYFPDHPRRASHQIAPRARRN